MAPRWFLLLPVACYLFATAGYRLGFGPVEALVGVAAVGLVAWKVRRPGNEA